MPSLLAAVPQWSLGPSPGLVAIAAHSTAAQAPLVAVEAEEGKPVEEVSVACHASLEVVVDSLHIVEGEVDAARLALGFVV